MTPDPLLDVLHTHRETVYPLLCHFLSLEKPFLSRAELHDAFERFCEMNDHAAVLRGTALEDTLAVAQEAAGRAPWLYLALRPRPGRWRYLRLHAEAMRYEDVPVHTFLEFKEHLVRAPQHEEAWPLEIDLHPFSRSFPRLSETRSIGQGVAFLNRHLSNRLFQELGTGGDKLLSFLGSHEVEGRSLMLNERITDLDTLQEALRRAARLLDGKAADDTWDRVALDLQDLGFEAGWGRTVPRIRDTMRLLSDILEAPGPDLLERFLARIPMIFKVVTLSPHGFFGQDNVLGRPDTGGQVVYILDQVKALEKEMRRRLYEQGLDVQPRILVVTRLLPEAEGTSCNRRKEHIIGTDQAHILRVPFRSASGEVVPQWISRFEVWPYLERFALEVEQDVLAELGGRPDLLIGNYSDGSLVATLLARRLNVTQCNIAHALEKNKYVHSDLYWQGYEEDYHFGAQFTADLISMNAADFIVTSTYQEIAGRADSVGQYESYKAFTMPDLCRVTDGIDIFDPRFNIVSPGADEDVFFPYTEDERRLRGLHEELEEMIFGGAAPDARGRFEDPDKPLLFTMARLDHNKNIAGLVGWYGRSPQLRQEANLLVVAGHVDAAESDDQEEQEEIARMHALIDEYGLARQLRWLGRHLQKNLAGELYRYVADRRGAFVQPGWFEGFGLTVIEAMVSGLPTFATCHGGPLEIIEHGTSGFHIDPYHEEEAVETLVTFLRRCRQDPAHWAAVSEGGIRRVHSRYTWAQHAERLMTLARVYGFWKHVTNLERDEARRYLELLYALQFRPLARQVPVATTYAERP